RHDLQPDHTGRRESDRQLRAADVRDRGRLRRPIHDHVHRRRQGRREVRAMRRREGLQMTRKREAGYSLVEVLIALGLMTGVMVAVCSMFVLGGTYVKSGKQLTQATAL